MQTSIVTNKYTMNYGTCLRIAFSSLETNEQSMVDKNVNKI